jgi:hypothetical protein
MREYGTSLPVLEYTIVYVSRSLGVAGLISIPKHTPSRRTLFSASHDKRASKKWREVRLILWRLKTFALSTPGGWHAVCVKYLWHETFTRSGGTLLGSLLNTSLDVALG